VNEIIQTKPKILVIVGPTASGKTSLSITFAKKFNGEIISADSRQVYTGLDLGTGKVTQNEMMGIPHHLLDVADPLEIYTVADFVRDGRIAIDEIHAHKKLPIIVGGTFLYIDALLGKISTPEVPPNAELRAHLEKEDIEALYRKIKEQDPQYAKIIDAQNKRKLIRALEIIETLGVIPPQKNEALYDTCTLGITISKETLRDNISKRLIMRVEHGMIEEVQKLHSNGISYERLKELGLEYNFISQYLENTISKDEMTSQIVTKSMQYAKRQMTWLKRNNEIHWFESNNLIGIDNIIKQFLEI